MKLGIGAAAVAFCSAACSLPSYFGPRLVDMGAEKFSGTPPHLARDVAWLLEETLPNATPNLYLGDEPIGEEQPNVPLVLPDRAAAKAIDKISGPELDFLKSLQPEHLPPLSAVELDHVGKTARYGLGVYAIAALGHASMVGDIHNVVSWALKDTGLIGPTAPADSVMFVYIQRISIETDFGWRWDNNVRIVLVRDGTSTLSVRANRRLIYNGTPDQPPPNTVTARQVANWPGGDDPFWLLMYYDVALLLRSAGYELAYAEKAQAAGSSL